MHRLIATLAAAGCLLAQPAFGYVSGYQVGLGPYVGGGTVTGNARVRHTSGYFVAVEQHWQLAPSLYLGPRFEIANGFVNTKAKTGDVSAISTYDNRIFSGGLRLSRTVGNPYTLAQGAYLTAMVGQAYTKLSVDEASRSTFRQNLYGNISGPYASSELGGWIPLRGTFGINLALLGSIYRADQSKASGSFQGDDVGPGGELTLTQGPAEAEDLANSVTIRTVAMKVGVSIGF